MREEFERWARTEEFEVFHDGAEYIDHITNCAWLGWQARQPEIDALMRMQEEWIKKWLAVVEENDALKAENERLRKDAEEFATLLKAFMFSEVQSREEVDAGKVLIQKYTTMKDFSTT